MAIKLCSEEVSHIARVRCLTVSFMLQKFNHKNIIKLIGLALAKQPVFTVMELATCCQSYLKNIQKEIGLSLKEKLKLCHDCASGMHYLEQMGVIHRY